MSKASDDVISVIFGPDHEWWKSDTEITFNHAADFLLERGFTQAEAVEFLGGLYYAVAQEYGE